MLTDTAVTALTRFAALNSPPSEPEDSRSAFARYAEKPTPRYTSYPTAPHFHDGVDEAAYRDWLAEIDPAAPVSLYLHVPFCKQVCWYCGCNMKLAARYDPVALYVETLLREIDLLAEAAPAGLQIAHLHWGGGTPTALKPDDLERVMTRIGARFAFTETAERAVEADPRTLTDEMIERLGALGFTRASFGVQEFDPDVQAAINRIQPPEMVAACVRKLRAAGVAAINFDLIYGLPRQTAAMLERTAALSIEMAADRIALFGYAHVPWMAKNQRMICDAELPKAEARLDQAARAAAAFAAAGYEPIGIDHLARPSDPLAQAAREGRLRRNFQGYTTDAAETLIGLGATSIGKTPGGYVQNISETGAWRRAVESGALPIAKGVALTPEDKLRAFVIERLMCDAHADLAAAGRRFGAAPQWWAGEEAALLQMAGEDLVTLENGQLVLTETGATLRRVVAAVFDRYLGRSAGRHSRAV